MPSFVSEDFLGSTDKLLEFFEKFNIFLHSWVGHFSTIPLMDLPRITNVLIFGIGKEMMESRWNLRICVSFYQLLSGGGNRDEKSGLFFVFFCLF